MLKLASALVVLITIFPMYEPIVNAFTPILFFLVLSLSVSLSLSRAFVHRASVYLFFELDTTKERRMVHEEQRETTTKQ